MLNYEQRKELKQLKSFRKTNSIWGFNHFNSKSNIGSMNSTFKKFYNSNKSIFDTLTVDDFMNYYYQTTKDRKVLSDTSTRLYNACVKNGIELTRQEAYYFTIIRVIDETWDGFKRELRMIDYLKTLYPDCVVDFTGEEDCEYCVDLKVSYDGVVLDYFQVKPYSFYDGLKKNNFVCVNAYEYNIKKHEALYKDTEIKACFLIEDENGNHIIKKYDELI